MPDPQLGQYQIVPVDGDPWQGAGPAAANGAGFDSAVAALHLTEDDKQKAYQAKLLQDAAASEANPIDPRTALLQSLDPRVPDDKWGQDLRDSLTKEGASSGTRAAALGLGVIGREISRVLGAPSQALDLGKQSEALRQASPLLDPATREAAGADVAGQSLGLAAGLMGGGTPFAEPGGLGIFGGRLSQTANGRDLAAAQLKTSLGIDPTEVWQQHGWYQDVDGQWKHEIPDTQAKLNPTATAERLPAGHVFDLGAAMHHPALFAAYPEAKNWGLGFDARDSDGYMQDTAQGPVVQINPSLPRDQQLSVALHEIQHAVQEKEGFAQGAAPATLQPHEQAYVNAAADEYKGLQDKSQMQGGLSPEETQRASALQSLLRQADDFDALAYQRYQRSAGETEARNVQSRLGMTPEESRSLHPDLTADVEPQDRRVAFHVEGGPMSVPQPPKPLLPSGWHPDAHAMLRQEHDFLAPQLSDDSPLLARIREAMSAGPQHETSPLEMSRPVVQAAQQAHNAAIPGELTPRLQAVIDQLHASKQEASGDGESFWKAPEPEAPYTRAEVEQLANHGYHMVEDHNTAPVTRSWVWSKELPAPKQAGPAVSLNNLEQQPSVQAQRPGMTTTPDSRLASSLEAFPTPDPHFHGHFTHALALADMHAPEFLDAMLGSNRTSTTGMHLGNGGIDLSSAVTSRKGSTKGIGAIQRTLNMPDKSVEHDYFELGDAQQGKGLAKKTLASAVDLYKKMGLSKVNLFANINVGGYAWAKYGFQPRQQAWAKLRQAIPQSDVYQSLPEDVREELDKHLAAGPKGLWGVSDMTFPVETEDYGTLPLGKALLLDTRWHGTLPLGDKDAMERFQTYVSQAKR